MGESAATYETGVTGHRGRSTAAVRAVEGDPSLGLVRSPTPYERWLKPALDGVLSALLLTVTLPLMGVVAAAVYLRLGSPVLHRQERVGLGGRRFVMLKFRTMHPDRRVADVGYDGPERRQVHKSRDDPRHTPLGRVLRRASLDELPQLVNVLRGEMSLVGPRPELPAIVDDYEPWQHRRHDVRPGITGVWQVTARNGAAMREYTHLDLEYLEEVSFTADVRILLLTVPAVLGRRPGE